MKNRIIKVCGMREPDNIRAVAALGIDMMGFIFYPQSPRYVASIPSDTGILPDRSSLAPLPDAYVKNDAANGRQGDADVTRGVKRVGVFVDGMPQNIVTAVYNYHLDYVQLHGSESPVMIDNLRRTLVPDIVPQIKIIKAISVASVDDLQQCGQYEGKVDLFLFDTKCSTHGGSGQQYDWSVLNAYSGSTPFLLSGGIGPGDEERIRAFQHPKCVGIDLNSRFETAPGVKDVEKLREFIQHIRQ